MESQLRKIGERFAWKDASFGWMKKREYWNSDKRGKHFYFANGSRGRGTIEGRTIPRVREGARAASLGDKSRAERAFDDHLGQAAREMPRERPRKKV